MRSLVSASVKYQCILFHSHWIVYRSLYIPSANWFQSKSHNSFYLCIVYLLRRRITKKKETTEDPHKIQNADSERTRYTWNGKREKKTIRCTRIYVALWHGSHRRQQQHQLELMVGTIKSETKSKPTAK